jgi:acyl-CoA synthetase (NDP forming)
MITRMSNLEFLDPAIAVSLGNQVDLTVSDFIFALAHRPDIDCIGVYMEGFNDLDGMEFLHAVEQATAAGKVVVFYKAGRTAAGRTAAQGHTASLAGDYDVCDAAVAGAGAIVTETFKEFEQLIELATDLHGKKIGGRRLGAVSNAGYETVGMADATRGARYRLEMPALSVASRERLEAALARRGLDNLVNARNPLDLTPMADDEAYEESIRVMLESDSIDAVIVGCVPMTPQLLTLPDEIDKPGSIAKRIPALFAEYDKPIVFVVDCAAPYDALARAVREAGVPVFRSADQAVRSLGRYLCHRAAATDGLARAEASRAIEPSPGIPCFT